MSMTLNRCIFQELRLKWWTSMQTRTIQNNREQCPVRCQRYFIYFSTFIYFYTFRIFFSFIIVSSFTFYHIFIYFGILQHLYLFSYLSKRQCIIRRKNIRANTCQNVYIFARKTYTIYQIWQKYHSTIYILHAFFALVVITISSPCKFYSFENFCSTPEDVTWKIFVFYLPFWRFYVYIFATRNFPEMHRIRVDTYYSSFRRSTVNFENWWNSPCSTFDLRLRERERERNYVCVCLS